MVILNISRKWSLSASSLIEVLIALVILLSVFAVGMMIFAQLVNTSIGTRQTQVTLELKQLSNAYINGDLGIAETPVTSSATYHVEEELLATYTDCKRVVFYAYDLENTNLMDSLVLILPLDENEDTL